MTRFQVLLLRRREKLKQLTRSIPHILTLINALCGFLAIIKAVEGDMVASAYYIIIAALIDGCDGRVARALNCTSSFGCELDSLADAVSFCGAPMVIMYQWIPGELGSIGALFLGLYVCAGLWRLAKFNSCTKESSHFVGLPTTAGALIIALLIVYEPWVIHHAGSLMRQPSLLGLVAVLGWLMVSPVAFVKLNRYKVPALYQKVSVLAVIFTAMSSHCFGFPLLLLAVMTYVASSLIYAAYKALNIYF